MEIAAYLEAKTRDGTVYSRRIFRDENVEEVMDRIQEEEGLQPGELMRNIFNIVSKPLEEIPAGEDKEVDYIVAEDKVIWRSGPLKRMSKFRGTDGYCHVPPQCIQQDHDCHVLKQFGGLRSDAWPCNCGRERTDCCALTYWRGLAQWEMRLKIVGLLKANKETLTQQVNIMWLTSDEEDKDRSKLWEAEEELHRAYRQGIWDIRGGGLTGVTQNFADAVLANGTPTGDPLDEYLEGLGLDCLVGRLHTVKFTGQMWPQVEREMQRILRKHQ